MIDPICSFCGKPVTFPEHAYRRVVGWERKREIGGTNALALREQLEEWAHVGCVELPKAGVGGQEAMF